jgi:hypothetical protein
MVEMKKEKKGEKIHIEDRLVCHDQESLICVTSRHADVAAR